MINTLYKNVVSFCAFFGLVFSFLFVLSLTSLSDFWVFLLSALLAIALALIDSRRPIVCIHRMAVVSAYVTVSYILAGATSLFRHNGFEVIFVLAIINMIISSVVLTIRVYLNR